MGASIDQERVTTTESLLQRDLLNSSLGSDQERVVAWEILKRELQLSNDDVQALMDEGVAVDDLWKSYLFEIASREVDFDGQAAREQFRRTGRHVRFGLEPDTSEWSRWDVEEYESARQQFVMSIDPSEVIKFARTYSRRSRSRLTD